MAENGCAAVAALLARHYALVLMNIQRPQWMGWADQAADLIARLQDVERFLAMEHDAIPI